MIARDDQLEFREELEEITPHESRRNFVSPVKDLIFDSAHRTPSSVSMAVTNRAPRKPARSVGCCSVELAVNDDGGAVFA